MQMMGTSAPGFYPPPGWNQKEKKRKEIGNKCFKKSVSFQLSLFSWPNLVEEENSSSFLFGFNFSWKNKTKFLCLFLSQNLKQIKNNRGDPILSKTFFPISPSLP
jgi:hypothetical protein